MCVSCAWVNLFTKTMQSQDTGCPQKKKELVFDIFNVLKKWTSGNFLKFYIIFLILSFDLDGLKCNNLY